MNMISHMLKKDILRLRCMLMAWLAIVGLSAVASGLNASAAIDDYAIQRVVQLSYRFVEAVQFIVLALMVPILIMSEPFSGTDGFWLTRPLKRKEVILSKAIFSAFFFVLIPVIANMLVIVGSGLSFWVAVKSLPALLLMALKPLLFLCVAAVLAAKIWHYALVVGVSLVALLALDAGLAILQELAELSSASEDRLLADSRWVWSSLFGVIASLVVMAVQISKRRMTYSCILLGISLLIYSWILAFSHWNLFCLPANKIDESEWIDMEFYFDKNFLLVADVPRSRPTQPSKKKITSSLMYDGLEPIYFIEPEAVSSRYLDQFESRWTNEERPCKVPTASSLVRLLEPTFIHLGSTYLFHQRSCQPCIMKLNTIDYELNKQHEGRFEMELTFDLYRYQERARLPLTVGSMYHTGEQALTISSILHETEGCLVLVNNRSIQLPLVRSRTPYPSADYLFLLYNPHKDEAYLPLDEKSEQGDPKGGHMSWIAASVIPIHFSSLSARRYSGQQITPISEEWLQQAELIIIEKEWLGRASKLIEDEAFSLQRSKHELNAHFLTRMDEIAKIEFPSDRSTESIRSYIQQIFSHVGDKYSVTVSLPNRTDIPVQKLEKVGRENMNLLLRYSDSRNRERYALFAIEKLVREDDKEFILQHLYDYPALMDVVMNFGWEPDAKEILIRGLKTHRSINGDWFLAVAKMKDPETYPLLLDRFIHANFGRKKLYAYLQAASIPGIAEAVPKMWKAAQYSFADLDNVYPIAMEHGIVDALYVAIERLQNGYDYEQGLARRELIKFVGPFAADQDLFDWYAANKGQITFDSERKKFMGPTPLKKGAPEPISSSQRTLSKEGLMKVKLSEGASRQEVSVYLKELQPFFGDSRFSNESRLWNQKLTAVGSENIDLLLTGLASEFGFNDAFRDKAIADLATVDHKAFVLENLATYRGLIEVVVRYHWQDDVMPMLLEGLEKHNNLPKNWVQAVADRKNRGDYPLLLSYFERAEKKMETYSMLRFLPEIRLAPSLDRILKSIRFSPANEQADALSVLLDSGSVEALDYAIEEYIDNSAMSEFFRENVCKQISLHTGVSADVDEIQLWYAKSKSHISFDSERKLFVGLPLEEEKKTGPKSEAIESNYAPPVKEDLMKIELPEGASRQEVEAYLNELKPFFERSHFWNEELLWNQKLTAVGSENIDLLLTGLASEFGFNDAFRYKAIADLATVEHKAFVLENLAAYTGLIEVVVKYPHLRINVTIR
jgi:hypothetical protein